MFDLLDPKSLDFQVPRSPNFQVPRFPDAAAGSAGAGRILRSQPDHSPNAPRDQIRRKGPCCDFALETHVPNSSGNWHGKYMPILCKEYMLFFCLPLSIQPRLNTQQQGRAPQCGSPPRGVSKTLWSRKSIKNNWFY